MRFRSQHKEHPPAAEANFEPKNYPEIAPGVPFPETPGDSKHFEVAILGPHDPEIGLNWSLRKKLLTTGILAYLIFLPVWGSAVLAAATPDLMELFHIGLPVAMLSVSLYVVGFAVGPILWGPSSDLLGRKPPLFIGILGLTVFMFAGASAKDLQTVLLSRFFQGTFGSASLSVGPAMAGDLYLPKHTGVVISIICFCVIAGPMIAPVVGAYIQQSFLGWRWTMYISGIMSSLGLILLVPFPETQPRKILMKRAARLRKETGNWAIHAAGDMSEFSPKDVFHNVIVQPIKMLMSEPILTLISLYHGFIYGILYLCLGAIPIVFSGYHWPGANVYLPYLALMSGAGSVIVLNVLTFDRWYNKQLILHKKKVIPENRLPLMILCGGVFAIGIFWMCWTAAYAPHVHWLAPVFGAGVLGFGMIGLFVAAFNYILDTYLMRAGTAFAANTFVRSAFGCAFPLFAHPMFINLGTQWAGTLLGCLAVLLFPVPILFYIFGARIRSWSKYAMNLEDLELGRELGQPRETGPESGNDKETESNSEEEQP